MSEPPPGRPDGVRFNKRVNIAIVLLLIAILLPTLGYYAINYYSATRLTVNIISGARTLGNPINYTLLVQITIPGAVMPVSLWSPTVSLFLDSFDLGGVFPCLTPNSQDVNPLNPSDQLTCRGYWKSSFADAAGQHSAEAALNKTNTNHLVLWVYFHQVESGWYNQEVLKTISTDWTWS